jgi:glycogen operon protein
LFDKASDRRPWVEIELDPYQNRTGDVWHIHIYDLGGRCLYLYRVDGPYEPEKGHRFNEYKYLIDPYTKALTGGIEWELHKNVAYDPDSIEVDLSMSAARDASGIPKCIVVDDDFDWQGDRPLNYPLRFSVIYETHVRGLSRHASSGVQHPGTYRGVVEMIPYLKNLGITSLELLPIQEFDERENKNVNPATGEQLTNYWGYSTLAFFAPKASYSSAGGDGRQVQECKEMIRELHRAGIEVILDVVFNHTAEGNETGPTLSFRGLDNSIYYMLEDDKRHYRNFSGCGNTVNCNHPIVRSFILDVLRYWVVEMHVDGFRFDLGSILGRDQDGRLMENPPVLERIAEDPVLRDTKIIAEAWDAAGAYQVGSFPGGRWAEWNDRYRDDIRRFWRGDKEMVAPLATRITGSSDLYLRDGRKPFHSINFITSHDGFTLYDLVSYNRKHNLANGEGNSDGHDYNFSFNHGVEGDTADEQVLRVRRRAMKNYFATLLLSLGTPMILGGDELGRTQRGNNNAYCQDNEISWYDYDRVERFSDVHRFFKEMIAFRFRHPAFLRPEFYTGVDNDYNAIPDVVWYSDKGREMNWAHQGKTLALRIDGSRAEISWDRDDNDFYIMFNAGTRAVPFVLCPPPKGRDWYLAVDTAAEAPDDVRERGKEPRVDHSQPYKVADRSMVVLIAKQ